MKSGVVAENAGALPGALSSLEGAELRPVMTSGNAARRRVLYVEANEDGTVGGSHACLFDLATNVDADRFEPVALFYQQNSYVDALRRRGIEVHLWEDIRRDEQRMYQAQSIISKTALQIQAVVRRARFIRQHRIDLVHLNNAITTSFDDWLPAAHYRGIPCVSHARGQGPLPGRWIWWWMMTRFDRVIAISDFIGGLARAAGIPTGRIRRVYDSIDTARFLKRVARPAADIRQELHIDDGMVFIVMVAHLRSWKGQDAILAGLAKMDPAIRRQVRIAFVGGTPEVDAGYAAGLRETVKREGLTDNVMFLGERSDVPDLANAADILVHGATQPEPFGLVVLEAMALGKPLIASRLGGPAEIVTPDSGILFDPANPAELGRILERLVAEPDLRASLRSGALDRVKEFSIRRTIDGVQDVYAELLDVRRPDASP